MHEFAPYPGFWFFPVGMIVFLVILLVVGRFCWGPRWRDYRNWYGHDHRGAADEILKQRYARGEINKEEFERIRKELKNS